VLASTEQTDAVHFFFSATLFLGHGFGTIPAPGSFADSALFGSSQKF